MNSSLITNPHTYMNETNEKHVSEENKPCPLFTFRHPVTWAKKKRHFCHLRLHYVTRISSSSFRLANWNSRHSLSSFPQNLSSISCVHKHDTIFEQQSSPGRLSIWLMCAASTWRIGYKEVRGVSIASGHGDSIITPMPNIFSWTIDTDDGN